MSESISLFDLLNVSIGTPHESSVNFSALHALLLAVLKQLDIRGLKIQWRGSLPGETFPVTSDLQLEEEDEKVDVEAQRDVPEMLPGTGSDGSPIPDLDSTAISTRIQTCEGGVLEALELIKELQEQKDDLKEKIEELHQQSKAADSHTQTLTEVEKCCHRVDTLENAVSSLGETLQKYPEPEKLSQCLDFVQSAQFNTHFSKGPTNTDVMDSTTPVKPHSPNIRTHTPPSSSPDEQGTAPASPSDSESVLNPAVQVKGDPDTTNDNVDSFEKVSSSAWYQEMMVAVNTTNKLQEKVIQLEGRMSELEEQKIDQVQLAQLNELINNKGSVRSNNMMAQLNQQKVLIEDLMSDRDKNIGLMKDVQRAVLQLQEDCEKLQETTRILHEDSGQKQGLIEEIYAMMEELEVKTTNMQEQETKTAEPSPEVTVSHQVDAVKEQLETEVQELPKKVLLPEDSWHQFFHRLSSEMETKVNRIEVDYLMLQLEKRWKTIEDKLESPEHDSACLIKKELFHCLSCDRPVLMQVPGPIVNTLPSSPAFPSHKSTRPLNADQQQNKRMKPGTSRYNCWISTPGRKRAAFQRSYNDMYKQIESMESAWRRQDNWDNTNQNPAGVQHEWTSELMDNQAVARSCGGSHANTSGLQSTKLLTQTEADSVTQEIGIIGLDGHIYKDCLSIQALKNTETKLPTIATKDGMCKTKNKAKSSASHRRAVSLEVGQTTPVHQLPPSARSMQCSRSASSCSGRDWPVSALGCCTSQSSITQTSAAAESAADPQSDEPLNL
uniref:Glutamine rich 2 n=3 Tax=Iconisemion striatum TaxID=60296 RepID=A0A1A7XAF5_9TELE